MRSVHGAIFLSSTSRRSSISMRGMSIRTGHASAQAPQSDEAWARSFTGRRALEHRRQEDPDRPGIRVAVGVAADLAVHRADVQAGAAAKARERLAQRSARAARSGRCRGAPGGTPRGPRARPPPRGPCTSVVYDGELLPRRALREDRQEHHEVAHRGHDLLDAHHRDVDPRQRGDHPPVALVGHQDDRARVGDREVRAGDPEVGLQELLAQLAARDPRQRLRVRLGRAA